MVFPIKNCDFIIATLNYQRVKATCFFLGVSRDPQQKNPALSIRANIGLDPRRRCVADLVDLVDLASHGKTDGNMGNL